ncbi:MAG: insulinase family protein [Clostridia bacterium]|nr:insulinase family protein [Clostridia bacterium]
MKKILSLFLVLTLMFSTLSALAEPAPADTAEAAGLPAVGDVVEGFEVRELRPFDAIGGSLVYFEHQKTGAKLLYISNEDTNRAFQLSFPTRPIDNTGLPHVFEHSTLSGSEKYPSTALFFNLLYQSYTTFMNAYTADIMTSYPVSSLSEAQLLSLADYYTDSCLHPMIMKDESIYRTEAWRYEMEDLDSPLTLNGTVYSEMTGALTLQRSAEDNAKAVTFPGSVVAFDPGGVPAFIPDMTWDSLKEYHNRFYHPSNCIAFLYGSFEDYTAFLKLLNEAFSPYDKQDFTFTDSGYTRITEPVVQSFPYAVAKGTDTANQSSVYYYILCPGLRENKEEQRIVDHADILLNSDSSPLMQNLKKAFPSGNFTCNREPAGPDDAVLFAANNVNPDDAETFRTIVNDSLKQIVQDGFDPVQVDASAALQQLLSKLVMESGSPVQGVVAAVSEGYALTGNPFEYCEQMEALAHIQEENEKSLFTAAIGNWLADPALYTLTTTYPEPGLKEKQDAALADKLAEIKAGMTDEEKQAVVDATHAEPEEEDTSEMIASLTAVTVSDLPEKIRQYPYTDETGKDGVRRISAVAGVDGIGYIDLFLDARGISQEDLQYAQLFTQLLGHLDTDAHTKEELAVLTERYLTAGSYQLVSFDTPDKSDIRAYMLTQWIGLEKDLAASYDLIKEVLFHTQFTDVQALSDRITALKANVRGLISAYPFMALTKRQAGIDDPNTRMQEYLNNIPFYTFLENVEQQIAAEPESVVARLQAIQSFLANRTGAVATIAGNENTIAVNAPLVDTFFADLPAEERAYPAYDLPVPGMKEGLSVDGNIQYNCIGASFKQLGIEPNYAYNIIGTIITDQLLIPVLRDQMGAYGVTCGMSDNTGLMIYSYRDPNVKATFDLYDSIPEKLAALELTQEQIDGYIMSQYSAIARPAGELTGAVAQITSVLRELPEDERLKMMRDYKSVTPETVKNAAAVYALLNEKGARGTAGSIGALQANSDLYDVILNPFHTEDLSRVSFSDVAEDNEHHDAIYAAFTSGLIQPKEETLFAPDEPATVGNFLGGLYMLIGGGSNDPEACKAGLSAGGLLSADQDLNAELNEGFLSSILAAMGAASPTETPDAAVSRAELAELFIQLTNQ